MAQISEVVHPLQHAAVRVRHQLVVFVRMLFFMTALTHYHCISCDLARVNPPLPVPSADREDAIKVFVMRDGEVFFETDRADPAGLPQKIVECLKDRGVERKVYIVLDRRARWGSIKPVLDGVCAAGILRIAFLVDQRRAGFHI